MACGGIEQEYRFVLLGKTGSGKSATGNSIIGREAFGTRVSESSITKSCQYEETDRFGHKLSVVDTPGAFDTSCPNNEVMEEVSKCLGLSAPGPHVFLYVFSVLGRYTQEEDDTLKQFVEKFGERVYDYMIIVFTRKDDLDKNNTPTCQYLSSLSPGFQSFLRQCGRRFCWFDNTLKGREETLQVKTLIDKVHDLVQSNGSVSYYTNSLYEEAERLMLQREKEIEKDIQKSENEIKVLLIREESVEKKRKDKQWEIQDIEKRINDLKRSCPNKKSTRDEYPLKRRGNSGRDESISQKLSYLQYEQNKRKREDLELQEKYKKLQTQRDIIRRQFSSPYGQCARTRARRELTNGRKKFSKVLLHGIMKLSQHLLGALIGFLLL